MFPWGGVAPTIPFTQSIDEHDVVDYSSEGTTKIQLAWISPHPVPTTVRVWVQARAWYFHNGSTGVGTCQNGLGSTVQVHAEGGEALGFQTVDVPVSPVGFAEHELNQAAEATQPSIYIGGVMVARGQAHAGVTVNWGIDNRRVRISINGGEAFRPDYTAGTPANAGIEWSTKTDWWTGNDYNTAGTSGTPKDPSFDYVVPARKQALVVHEGSNNIASWTLGVPLRYQEKREEPFPFGTTLTPATVPDQEFMFAGQASSQFQVGEWHRWNGGPTVAGHQIDPISVFKPSPYVRDNKLYQPVGVMTRRWPQNFPRPETQATLLLEYGWADSTTRTATRHVTFIDQYKTKTEFPPLLDANRHATPVTLVGHTDKTINQQTVEFLNPTFSSLAISALFGVADSVVGMTFAEFPADVTASLALGSLKGVLLAYFPSQNSTATIHKDEYAWGGERWSEWENPGGGPPVHSQPAGTSLAQYHWSVKARPKRMIKAVLEEDWGTNGFTATLIRKETRDQLASIAPRLWKFSLAPDTGGGSGGGAGGGSQ